MKGKYTVGVDFGTLSARAVLAEAATGRELASAEAPYAHGVMEEALPTGEKLPPKTALQHPQDWLDSLTGSVSRVMAATGADPAEVAGLALDFTSCTVLPAAEDGTPLCFLPAFEHEPQAWPKLWKHHSAQPEADEIVAKAAGRAFLARAGGTLSCEMLLPKVTETLRKAPAVYAAADTFTEAGDWLTRMLTGRLSRNVQMAGYKALWSAEDGYPDENFMISVDPGLAGFWATKYRGPILPQGTAVGGLAPEWAAKMGLAPGTTVAAANIDAHTAAPSAGMTEAGELLLILGTSTCIIVCGTEDTALPGGSGAVRDAVLPGLVGHEAGQSCTGDMLNWYVTNAVPGAVEREAEARGLSVHQLLTEQAARLAPGENGLVALDWWNGTRSVLQDTELTGLIAGLTLKTTPAEIYRALMEATAYGARVIVEGFEKAGIPIHRVICSGGMAAKNPLLLQIYADVLKKELRVASGSHAGALGSAVFAAAAAGLYPDVVEASRAMGGTDGRVITPDPEAAAVYDRLFDEYMRLHETFGRQEALLRRLRHVADADRTVIHSKEN